MAGAVLGHGEGEAGWRAEGATLASPRVTVSSGWPAGPGGAPCPGWPTCPGPGWPTCPGWPAWPGWTACAPSPAKASNSACRAATGSCTCETDTGADTGPALVVVSAGVATGAA